jgi:hypothetical protein
MFVTWLKCRAENLEDRTCVLEGITYMHSDNVAELAQAPGPGNADEVVRRSKECSAR